VCVSGVEAEEELKGLCSIDYRVYTGPPQLCTRLYELVTGPDTEPS